MSGSLDTTFKTVVSLDKQRFKIWEQINLYKNDPDVLITFYGLDDNHKKYACINFSKLLEIIYGKE